MQLPASGCLLLPPAPPEPGQPRAVGRGLALRQPAPLVPPVVPLLEALAELPAPQPQALDPLALLRQAVGREVRVGLRLAPGPMLRRSPMRGRQPPSKPREFAAS